MNILNKDDSVGTSGDHFKLYGNGGLFTDAATDRNILNATLTPIGYDLPAVPTTEENPIFAALTGIDDMTGSFPTQPCEPGPTPGGMTVCKLAFPLGRVTYSSDSIDVDEVIMKYNRGDTRDMRLIGGVMGDTGFGQIGPNMNTDDILNHVLNNQMYMIGRAYQRWIAQKKWTGTPSNPNQSAGYKEFIGFDNLIKTGYRDVITNELCPAMDSDVKDFGGNCIDSGNGSNIYEYVTNMAYSILDSAAQHQLDPVEWDIVMRPEMWRSLTLVWPLFEYSFGATRAAGIIGSAANNIVTNLSGSDAAMATQDMRNRRVITIGGRNFNVYIDDGIAKTAAPNPQSSIYFIPRTVAGGQLVTYWEHKDYRAIGSELSNLNGKLRFWTDDGKYLWTTDERLWCFNVHSKIEPRLIFRAPFLAGRIDNICVSPLQLAKDPFVGNQGYVHNV